MVTVKNFFTSLSFLRNNDLVSICGWQTIATPTINCAMHTSQKSRYKGLSVLNGELKFGLIADNFSSKP